jgi:hypothetical protein
MYRLILALLCLMALPLTTHAVDWHKIADSSTGEHRYIDLESIRPDGDRVHYDSKTEYPSKHIRQAEFSWTLNCANATASLQAVKQFGPEHQEIFQASYTDEQFSPIPPDTMGDLYMRFTCQWATALERMTAEELIKLAHRSQSQE